MLVREPDNLFDGLTGLSLLLLSEGTVTSTLESVVAIAVGSIAGCRTASVTVRQEGRLLEVESISGEAESADVSEGAGKLASLPLPLLHEERFVGLLKLNSHGPEGLDGPAEESGRLLAAAAGQPVSDMIAYTELRAKAARLGNELNDSISRAAGILMERGQCSRAAAEERLQRCARRDGRTMDGAAQAVILSSGR
jgi:ANTAR domain